MANTTKDLTCLMIKNVSFELLVMPLEPLQLKLSLFGKADCKTAHFHHHITSLILPINLVICFSFTHTKVSQYSNTVSFILVSKGPAEKVVLLYTVLAVVVFGLRLAAVAQFICKLMLKLLGNRTEF